MKTFKVGIIGFGFMGKTHTYGYRTIPFYYPGLPFKIELAGVCSRTLENAQKARDAFGFGYATDNPDDILNDSDIDIINICTPNAYHKDAVIKAILAGKHIYCDKPLTSHFDDTQDIISLLDKPDSDIVTQMALQYRFFPATLRAKELIDEGRIGKVMSFRACYLHSGSVDPDKKIGWKQDIRLGGGGVLLDLGAHAIDLMYHFLGEYSSVFAHNEIIYSQRPDKSGEMVEIQAEDLSHVIVRMKSGATGTIEVSKIATGTNDELRFEIHGDKGAVRFNLMDPNWLDFYDNTLPDVPLGGTKGFVRIECVQRYEKPGGDFPGPKFTVGWIRAHVHSLFNFVNCVNEGKAASPSFKEGAYIQNVIEKAYESDREKRWVDLD